MRSHPTTHKLLPSKKTLIDFNLVQISCTSDPATLNYPRLGAQAVPAGAQGGGWQVGLHLRDAAPAARAPRPRRRRAAAARSAS